MNYLGDRTEGFFIMKSFASDNYSGTSLEILNAIQAANQGHVPSYGNDPYTQKAIALLKNTFGNTIVPYFVYNGTAANTLALKACIRSHHAIICADCAHINTQEVGAPVNFTGCSLITILNQEGKLTSTAIEEAYLGATYWGRHNNLPKVVSITQATEYGTVYTADELRAISSICKKYHLILHMDGCRLSNAAVALNCSLKELTADVGIDVLSFGGAKNGLLFGEAIIFFNSELAKEFEYIQKQGLQLHSKMRFLSAQFIPYLADNLWHRNALHANFMCKKLAAGLMEKLNIKMAYPVQTNQIFAYFTEAIINATQAEFFYYVWNQATNLVRLVTSFDTTEDEVNRFIQLALTASG